MRICLVTTSYSRFDDDGNARFIRSIAEAQAGLGHEVHVLAPYSPQTRPYSSPVHIHWFKYVWPARWGVMGHAAALKNDRWLRGTAVWQAPLFSLNLLLRLQQLVSRYQFDLLHAHWVIPAGVLVSWAARLNHKPSFISLHGSDMYVAQHNALWGGMARAAFRQAAGVTACSQPLADAAMQLDAMPDRVKVIPYGADPGRFDVNRDASELRRRLNLSTGTPIILALGRLVGKKGFSQLVRAMPQVLAVVPATRLIIVGEGPERYTLECLSRDLDLEGKVLLPGAVPWTDVPDYLAAAEVFVMPSVRDTTGNLDGLPNVILEAMAAGRPVVATRVAGIPLAVQHEQTGLLVDQADPDQLAGALLRLMTSPHEREAMGRVARARVESVLNWNMFARQIDEMYHTSGGR